MDKTKDEIFNCETGQQLNNVTFKNKGYFVYSQLISQDDNEYWVYRQIDFGEAVCIACIVLGSILAGIAGCFANALPLIPADESMSELIITLTTAKDEEKLDRQATKAKFGTSLRNFFADGNNSGNDKSGSGLQAISTNEYDGKDNDQDSDDRWDHSYNWYW